MPHEKLTSFEVDAVRERVKGRVKEFDNQTLHAPSLGIVRLVIDEYEAWQAEQDSEVVEDFANARQAAYERGYEDGVRDTNGWTVPASTNGNGTHVDSTPQDDPVDGADRLGQYLTANGFDVEELTIRDGAIIDDDPIDPANFADDIGPVGDLRLADVDAVEPAHDEIDPVKQLDYADDIDIDDDDIDDDDIDDPPAKTRKRDYKQERESRGKYDRKPAPNLHSDNPTRNHLPTREEFLAEVKRQSMGGVIPTMKFWNDAKPATWATAWSHMQRLGIKNWVEVAELCGLQMNRISREAEPAQ